MNKKQYKYARYEYERTFMLPALPKRLVESTKFKTIEDHYYPGTNMRLRIIKESDGEISQQKITQKFIPEGGQPSKTMITNIYLSEKDITIFKGIKGRIVKKKRYKYKRRQYEYSIDVFVSPCAGLILADIEFENDDDMKRYKCPFKDWVEVTNQMEFTGGALAFGKGKL